jgi:taurine dioxygenase
MPLSVAPLSPSLPFGKLVSGLVSDDLTNQPVMAELRQVWLDGGMIVFKDCEISEKFHVELSRVFGPLEIHPTREFRNKDNPELVNITAAGDRTEIDLDGERGEFQGWHKDLVHNQRINRGGILRALKPSSRGGLTGFVDGVDAYTRLPEDLKKRIENLHVVYQMNFFDNQPYATRSKVRTIKISEPAQALFRRRDRDYPPHAHPLVFVHPETNQKILNFSPGHSMYVEELSHAESDELMWALADHVFASPSYHHKWSTQEMVLWDNWRMLHSVSLIPMDDDRMMQRTTIAGDYGLGRLVSNEDFAARRSQAAR